MEKEEILFPTEPVTILERQLVVEEPFVQEDHYVTTDKEEITKKASDDVQILRKSEVAELLDFPKPNQTTSDEEDDQDPQQKEEQEPQQPTLVNQSESFESSVEKDSIFKSNSTTKESKEAEISQQELLEDGNLVKADPRKDPVKKESVAECLRRYREEEAKARRAAQMRKNYTLLSDEEPEVDQQVRHLNSNSNCTCVQF